MNCIEVARGLQAMSQTGLHFADDPYIPERSVSRMNAAQLTRFFEKLEQFGLLADVD